MMSEKDFQPPVESTNTESTEDKKEEIIESKEEDLIPNEEIDLKEEQENKGTEEERKVELSERFETILKIMDTQNISEENKEYFLSSSNGVGVFRELQTYIKTGLQKEISADEIEEKLDLFEYGVGELLKDDSDKEECDKQLVQFIQERIDHFVATFDQRIDLIEKSGRYNLQEGDIEKSKEKLNYYLKRIEGKMNFILEAKKQGKEFSTGDAKLLIDIVHDMQHIIPGVEAGHEAALLFWADDFEEEKVEKE